MSFSIKRTAADWVFCKSVPHCPASGADDPLRRGILRTLRFTPLIFASQKKSTDSKTGLQKAYVRMRCWAVQPSVAKALEGILRTLRFTPLIFASKKNLRIARLAYKKHMCGWDAEPFSPPSPRLWRASFARYVYDSAYFCKQKKLRIANLTACHP